MNSSEPRQMAPTGHPNPFVKHTVTLSTSAVSSFTDSPWATAELKIRAPSR